MEFKDRIINTIEELKSNLEEEIIAGGEILFYNGQCQILSQSLQKVEFIISDENGHVNTECAIVIEEDYLYSTINDKMAESWNSESFACLLQLLNELNIFEHKPTVEHKKYSRKGMMHRVLKERKLKAKRAEYKIEWANNIYGDHVLTNENGDKYQIFLRDFVKETGYSNSMDAKINKLGTTKHIMFAFDALSENVRLKKRLSKQCPFIEIYCDPLNDYKITWFYPHDLQIIEKSLILKYFGNSEYIDNEQIKEFLGFVKATQNDPFFRIRPEVYEKIELFFEERMLEEIKVNYQPDYSKINANLFNYQKEGVEFALFKKGAVIADEMGLGKTLQAISIAVFKKSIFEFNKTLVVCPASLKDQWKKEIERFTDEKAIIVDGKPLERAEKYKSAAHYFFIVNYETVLRDIGEINRNKFDFLILDEAQRVKNYDTKGSVTIKKIDSKHKLIITGTPIENRLIELYSILGILDPHFLGPLWEFSYQHCYFDPIKQDKINGYFNLQKLNKKLAKILIRREKRIVLNQLPNIQQLDVPVPLTGLQKDMHGNLANSVSRILRKKYLTPYDFQKLMLLMANMRMLCDSTYLVDESTSDSPKLEELKYLLLEKLDIKNNDRKIIIFSEWVKMHKIIGQMLRENGIGFVELNGKIPVKARGNLIKKFEENKNYKIFLSTEAGGAGLNLQVADTLINFELPWNPAKKNQRIGRIDRLGQKSSHLTIVNFISKGSIEESIAAGLLLKQNLFDGVLNEGALDEVDFSQKGRSQFIKQMEELTESLENNKFDYVEGESSKEAPEEVNVIEEMEPDSEKFGIAKDESLGNSSEKEEGEIITTSPPNDIPTDEGDSKNKMEHLEEVMNNGMLFLSGLFKMTTGKDMSAENQKIEIDKKTGEVVMRFKVPV